MKLKLRQKSLLSPLKKLILKLKEELALCPKQTSSTTKTYTEITDDCVQEIEASWADSINYINILSIINKSIHNRKNITVKWFYNTITINRTIKNSITIFNTKAYLRRMILKV
ncbi:MAG: hypothetical protein ACEPOV_03390 [Hyphomicrobiales bacterium]